jgi:glucoamylase
MRDGALVAHAWQRAGWADPSSAFFAYCLRVMTAEDRPYFGHKYNTDGTAASTWLPRVGPDGRARLPIQEDETALVVWGLWEHYAAFRELTYDLREEAYRIAFRAADWIAEFRGPTGLPRPSYDLWEERWGVHLWTVAACTAALDAAARFAELFDEPERRARYAAVASEMREAALEAFWSQDLGRFRRTLAAAVDGSGVQVPEDGDPVDASLAAVWMFDLLPADDARVVRTMDAVREALTVRTPVGGIARYERDGYQTAAGAHEQGLAGNPWVICTLWLAAWEARRARTTDDLARAREGLEWATRIALPSGVLAEQVSPFDGSPLSVSPLTWSHATFVSTVEDYLAAATRVTPPESRL